jgi:hypothetical protein
MTLGNVVQNVDEKMTRYEERREVLNEFVNRLEVDLHVPLLSPDYSNAMRYIHKIRKEMLGITS